MTEYDYSPQAYERHLATQNRIATWVDKTEQHRGEFQSANAAGTPPLADLTRSGPGPAKYNSPHHHPLGPSHPKQLVVHPPPPPSESSSSSSSGYYEGPWPARVQQPTSGTVLPPMQQHPLSSPPPMMMAPPFVTSPHRVPHHRHRSHDRRRSRSHHHSPTYYNVASPPLSPGYQYSYPGGNPGYVMMPQYGGTQMPVMTSFSHSAPASVTEFVIPTSQASYPQHQPNSAFLPSYPQAPSSQAWSTFGAAPYSMMSTVVGSPPLQSLQQYPAVPTYQSFSAQPPVQQSHPIAPRAHQRIYDLSRPENDKYYKRYVG